MTQRQNTHQVCVGNTKIGGGVRVTVQSMTNTRTADIQATSKQIASLCDAGC